MAPKAFRLNPLMQNSERVGSQGCHAFNLVGFLNYNIEQRRVRSTYSTTMPLPEGDRVFNIGSSIFVHLIKQIFTVF
jgi:hypothetical protein